MVQAKGAPKQDRLEPSGAEPSELEEDFAQGRGEVMETVDHILDSQDPMQGVMYHLNNLIAGEKDNKAAIFLLLLSAKVEDAKRKQIILVKGEPGAGKTTLMGIADLFNTKKIGRFTAHALDYTDLSRFDVLELQEVGFLDQEDQGVSTLKFVSSDDQGYTVACTVRDKDTGRFTAEEHRIPPITLVTSTTRVELDSQFERRAWPINPDESEQQTKVVRAFREQQQREENEVLLGLRPQTSVMHSQRVLRTLIGSLEPCRVVIPGCGALLRTLRTDRLRVRGDYAKLLNAIYVGAVLYQRQLPRIPNTHTVFATPWLVGQLLGYLHASLVAMTVELDERIRRLLNALVQIGKSGKNNVVLAEDRKDLARELKASDRTVRRYLDALSDAGYAQREGSGGKPVIYTLIFDVTEIQQRAALTWTKGDLDKNGVQVPFLQEMAREAAVELRGYLDKLSPPVGVQEEILGHYPSNGENLSRCPGPPQSLIEEQETPNGAWTRSLSNTIPVQAQQPQHGQGQPVQPDQTLSNCPSGASSCGMPAGDREARTADLSKSKQIPEQTSRLSLLLQVIRSIAREVNRSQVEEVYLLERCQLEWGQAYDHLKLEADLAELAKRSKIRRPRPGVMEVI